MHNTRLRRTVTLGDLLNSAGLELRAVSGGSAASQARIAGAHQTEILEPARWLARDWVMITTGLQLHRRPSEQRRLIRELAEQGVTALGYCLGIVSKNVPSALLDEARKLDYPVFTIPLHLPVRNVITHVNRMLLATDDELFHRALTIHDYLITGFDRAVRTDLVPEARFVANLRSLLELPVDYLDIAGRALDAAPGLTGDVAEALNAAPKQGSTKLRHGTEELLTVPCRLGARFTGWLVVHLPGRMEAGQFVLTATQAVARLIAMSVLSRQHSTENIESLRQELLAHLIADHPRQPLPATTETDLEILSHTRTLPILHQLGFEHGPPLRALLARPDESSEHNASSLKELLRRSKLPYLNTSVSGDLLAAVQGSGPKLREIAAGLAGTVGIGGPVGGVSALGQSVQQARFALRMAQREATSEAQLPAHENRYVDFEELPLALWMSQQAIGTSGQDRGDALLESLRAQPLLLEAIIEFLRHDQDIPAAAARLHLHPNSLRYRLDKCEAVLSAPIRRPSVLTSLYLAVTMAGLL